MSSYLRTILIEILSLGCPKCVGCPVAFSRWHVLALHRSSFVLGRSARAAQESDHQDEKADDPEIIDLDEEDRNEEEEDEE